MCLPHQEPVPCISTQKNKLIWNQHDKPETGHQRVWEWLLKRIPILGGFSQHILLATIFLPTEMTPNPANKKCGLALKKDRS